MNMLQQSRNQVLAQIQAACTQAGREPDSVQLLAVSKTQPSNVLAEMYQTGQRDFGENYLQEALEKITQLKNLEIEWHFIGHVQRNKTKHLAENFAWVLMVRIPKMVADQMRLQIWSYRSANCRMCVYVV